MNASPHDLYRSHRPSTQHARSAAALYPIDTIKTRLQAMRSGGGIRALLAAGGGRSLYAGVWGNLVGVAPASAVFMAVYEPVKQVGWQGGLVGAASCFCLLLEMRQPAANSSSAGQGAGWN